jgi:hypothetical protein
MSETDKKILNFKKKNQKTMKKRQTTPKVMSKIILNEPPDLGSIRSGWVFDKVFW